MAAADFTQPNGDRVLEFWLGGSDWLPVDREAAERVEAQFPAPSAPRQMAARKQAFLERAAAYAAAQGVSRFAVLGASLLPAHPYLAVHEAAPGARVAYVSNDPVVVSHVRALTEGTAGVSAVRGDVTDPAAVTGDLAGLGIIAPGVPWCAVLARTLQFMPAERARQVCAGYVAAMPPGSFLVISVPRFDDPELWERVRSVHSRVGAVWNHSPDEVLSFFAGTELVPPGLVCARGWRPERPACMEPDSVAYALCGIGIKD